MGDLYPVAGSSFYIGGPLATKKPDFVIADFSGQTWVEVDGYETAGPMGDAMAIITTPLINRGRDLSVKGTANAPDQAHNFAALPSDPGQVAMILAAQPSNRNNYAFKVSLSDSAAPRALIVTITIASPGVITWTAHGLAVGDQVSLATTGALPTGLLPATTYFVKTVLDANTFTVALTAGGTAIVTTGTQSGVHTATTIPTASSRYFIGLVTQAIEAGGQANTVRMLNATIKPNSNIVKVAGSPTT